MLGFIFHSLWLNLWIRNAKNFSKAIGIRALLFELKAAIVKRELMAVGRQEVEGCPSEGDSFHPEPAA